MRTTLVLSIAALSAILFLPAASAAPMPDRAGVAASSPIVQISHGCGPGYRWVRSGYAKHGKYRPGHCRPR